MATRPLDNAITMSGMGLVLGKSVTNFFLKRKIETVSIIIDYKNKSLILWGDNPSDVQPDDITACKNGRQGFKLYYPGSFIRKGTHTVPAPKEFAVLNTNLSTYIIFQNLTYLVRPLNNWAVIVENIILKDAFVDMRKVYINIKENFVLLGDLRKGPDIKPKSLVKAPATPLYANVNPRTTQKNVSTGIINTATVSTSQPIQTENTNENANEQDIPISEEAARADNEYKRMILDKNE
jgi:hypothetical protein